MLEHFYAVIMAGGGGTRLWPLSRQQHPKQALSLIEERTLFQASVDRLLPLLPLDRIFVVTAADQVGVLAEQYPQLPIANYIIEPLGRGTASCIGLAAAHLRHFDPNAVIAVVTADHHVEDLDAFTHYLQVAHAVADQGYLVTLGVKPGYAATGYGYIRMGQRLGESQECDYYAVAAFTEKPDRERAERFLTEGVYAWNSGMFVWRVDRILEEIERWMPALHDVLSKLDAVWGASDYQTLLGECWPRLEKETIDYGVMERADRVAVIPAEMGWTDIGSWASVMEVLGTDRAGNVTMGDVLNIEGERTMTLSRGGRLVVTIGVSDLIVVDTPDAVLITRRDNSQRVREVVDWLRAERRDDLL